MAPSRLACFAKAAVKTLLVEAALVVFALSHLSLDTPTAGFPPLSEFTGAWPVLLLLPLAAGIAAARNPQPPRESDFVPDAATQRQLFLIRSRYRTMDIQRRNRVNQTLDMDD